MTDERGGTWRIYLSARSLRRTLAIDVERGVIWGLSRGGGFIEYLVNSGNLLHPGFQNGSRIRLLHSLDELSGKYTLIVFGGGGLNRGSFENIIGNHCDANTSLVFLNWEYWKAVNEYLRNGGFNVINTIARLPKKQPRIYMPINSRGLVSKGLSFHKPGRLRVRFMLSCLRLLNNVGIHFLLKKNSMLIASKKDVASLDIDSSYQSWIEKRLGYSVHGLVAYAGSDSISRKITLLVVAEQPNRDVVAKIGDTPAGIEAISRESLALRSLAGSSIQQKIPSLLFEETHEDGSLVQAQTMFPKGGVSQVPVLTEAHFHFLRDLSGLNRSCYPVKESSYWNCLQEQIEAVDIGSWPAQMLDLLRQIEVRITLGEETSFHWTHGDFAPWNIYAKNDELFVFDWEDSRPDGPVGSDLLHFVFRQADLVGPWPGSDKLFDDMLEGLEKLFYVSQLGECDFYIPVALWILQEYIRRASSRLEQMADVFLKRNAG